MEKLGTKELRDLKGVFQGYYKNQGVGGSYKQIYQEDQLIFNDYIKVLNQNFNFDKVE